jgi:hypothetical protein
MAYSWDNRVKFVVRFMYDIDNNGFLDKNDFECLAVRNTIIESKGSWSDETFKKNQEIMLNLWNQIAELADFNKVNKLIEARRVLQWSGPLSNSREWCAAPRNSSVGLVKVADKKTVEGRDSEGAIWRHALIFG